MGVGFTARYILQRLVGKPLFFIVADMCQPVGDNNNTVQYTTMHVISNIAVYCSPYTWQIDHVLYH